ncbi:D-alanyl-D-alanine carboxypeptidase [Microbispora rosea subsp. aerata]|nr:D-alanyl-D-alanine carboxypeptidase family protein [Microbispora rosea]GGO16862.1 D-alanyl-D-alanine carboxypeptidase [Microbispora rosea subsp. aerata]GIH55977.1 D-alanyl-D-alanine carboxypeptidase [Microbispora rosea subsp. aerata]GLJ87277.1 D-alanyl-D-alanine carboxypeptidase [Microbispora rosea subsp. aerata]
MFGRKLSLGAPLAAFALITGVASPLVAPPALAAPAPAGHVSTYAPAEPRVYGRAVYLLDATTGRELLDKNAGKRMPVASLTKVMTAYIILREANLDDEIQIKREDVEYAWDNDGTTADLEPGDTLPVRELLYALMLPSGADAAHALARVYGPGVPGFVAKMNATARELGLNDTLYVNADGLPTSRGDGYSTARDQARLAEIALRNPIFKEITSASEHSTEDGRYDWYNTNHMLHLPGAIGVKTGSTNAAGFCLAFAADRGGHRLIGIILGEDVAGRRWDTAERLLDWASDR